MIAAEGADTLYTGTLAREVASDIQRNGGLLTLEDLQAYQVVNSEPLAGSYRGYDILTNRPPGGGALLVQMLTLLERFALRAMGHHSIDYILTIAVVQQYAEVAQEKLLGECT